MAVCSFLGHRDIYDPDIRDRLQAAAERIAAGNQSVEFLLYQHGDFSNQCMLAALRARNIFPRKVRITLVLPEDHFEHSARSLLFNKKNIPLCLVDRIVMPHIEPSKKEKDFSIVYKRTVQWMIQKSTHLICCLYRDLYEPETRLLDYAADTAGLEICDVASAETVQIIAETAATIPEREKTVYLAIKAGQGAKEIAKPLNVSANRVRQILDHGCKKIRQHLTWRYLKVQFSEKGGRDQSCSIFAAGEMTEEMQAGFEGIIDFLIEVYNVRNFYVEAAYSRSSFVKAIMRRSNPYRELRITAVTSAGTGLENDMEAGDPGVNFCPPCHASVCVGWADRRDSGPSGMYFDMIDLAGFCLCNFSEVPSLLELQRYTARTQRTVLLDLNSVYNNPAVQDSSFVGQQAMWLGDKTSPIQNEEEMVQ